MIHFGIPVLTSTLNHFEHPAIVLHFQSYFTEHVVPMAHAVFTDLGLGSDPGKTINLVLSRMSDLDVTGKPVTSESSNPDTCSKTCSFLTAMNVCQPLGGHFKEVLRPLRLTTSSWSQVRLAKKDENHDSQGEEVPGILRWADRSLHSQRGRESRQLLR